MFEKDGVRLGIIGLNSAFLQLDEHDYEGKLELNVRQIHGVCGEDADKWCAKNQFNVLLSHHPIGWLNSAARAGFRMDIDPPGRFVAHMCGHLHAPLVESLAEGGALPRRLIQGRSLFGLETYRDRAGNVEIQREHGYSAGRFIIDSGECRIRMWPRQNIKGYAGDLRIVADVRFNLDEDDAFELPPAPINGSSLNDREGLDVGSGSVEVAFSIDSTGTPEVSRGNLLEMPAAASSASDRLRAVPRWILRHAPQHAHVRTAEQESFRSGIDQHRAAWLIADWGLGKDGFLYSSLNLSIPQKDVFRLSCEGVTSIESLTSEALKQWGLSFQDFCVSVSSLADCCLVLDNLSEDSALNNSEGWVRRLDEIVQAALDIASSLKVVLVRRITPGPSKFPVTQLQSLDEPDCARYVSNHSEGGHSLTTPRVLEKLYAKSEGIPMHLDRLLEQLQTVSIDDLLGGEGEDLEIVEKSEPVPKALVQAVAVLQGSKDKYVRRSLRLLKVLTVLSHGEIFQNLRRFDPVDPFFPDNVKQLRDLGLIETVPLVSIGVSTSGRDRVPVNDPAAHKLLIVPRPVRDYVRFLMGDDERRAIVDGAMEVYFGSKWREGKPSLQPLTKIVVWENGMSGLGNHHSVIVSAVKDCLIRQNEQFFKRIFRIADAYLQALRSASKYRDLQHASEELFRILDAAGRRREAARVASHNGTGLRMLGQTEEAVRALELSLSYASGFGPAEFTKDWYAVTYLNLALAHQSNGDQSAAVKSANEVMLRAVPSSGTYSQAKSVIAECNIESKPKDVLVREFAELESEFRKKGHVVAANNIAFELADLLVGATEKRQCFDRVLDSEGDRYNQIRAAIKKAKLLVSSGDEAQLGVAERRIISDSYSYLYSQRFGGLFDDCHNVLWRLGAIEGKNGYLLRLFRYSSFLWRIFGRENKEHEYISQLREMVPSAPGGAVADEDRNVVNYYNARLRALNFLGVKSADGA
ncbi:tetratricopeptide repeat protein [Corallococcus interemptor]|uniref:tetratricopeptide repeat protein n=1 Tax=Corallococcus interemptor TaxID=2316720 RepID=UPI003D0915E6